MAQAVLAARVARWEKSFLSFKFKVARRAESHHHLVYNRGDNEYDEATILVSSPRRNKA